MFGVCSSMSSQRNADHERTVGCAKAPCNSSMEHGRRNRDFVSWRGRLRKGHRQVNTNLPKQVYLELVPNASAQEHPSRTDSNGRHERHPLTASNLDRPVTKVIYRVSALAYVERSEEYADERID